MFIKADGFIYPYEEKEGGYLELVDGRFGQWYPTVPAGAEVVDYTGFYVAPGLVDTHIHGYAGADVMDCQEESLARMSQALPETGVTSFLPTALTADRETLTKVCQVTVAMKDKVTGSKIQGLYFEGPYFTEAYKGAQNPTYMRNPSQQELDQWLMASQGLLCKLALAPERPGTEEFIAYAKAKGVKIALGHSNATYDQAKKAVAAGASVWVHAYNGMRGLNHRELGMLGAVYHLPETFAELICDGYHVHPNACDLLIKQKGHDRVALITDCMSAGGMAEGTYHLGEFPVAVADGQVRLRDGGSLAGSILQLKDAVKNIVTWGLASRLEAIRMASYIPAKSLGIEDRCGQIKQGLPADFIIMTKDLDLVATYVNGQKIWLQEE
ncbi:N-acetylglucosamine-6-phosphate deacetylase [Streptococcus cuniculipharyngis]|uniref:N-acetylglucosamine-6-phosphate deacetylase n=1 Tax=Streptococcus cuniculipharyngis TaxID=1562651 RepID=A0A5C5SCX6_9STRE|nr:N-acetylglucosamine-6-phosphate deacetylase [Streptococcus cuniculipharyngis]TWS98132.1 N-acetylglucosamine-6-phosphate deacetylase [Streptococcus cuniculipharyngis]